MSQAIAVFCDYYVEETDTSCPEQYHTDGASKDSWYEDGESDFCPAHTEWAKTREREE